MCSIVTLIIRLVSLVLLSIAGAAIGLIVAEAVMTPPSSLDMVTAADAAILLIGGPIALVSVGAALTIRDIFIFPL